MNEEEAKQLLEKYLEGRASTAEVKRVENWYAKLDSAKPAVPAERKQFIRGQILTRLKAATANEAVKKTFSTSQCLKIAAMLTIVFSLTMVFRRQSDKQDRTLSQTIVSTKVGERKKLILGDGSEIMLEPLTTIAYPIKFCNDARKIQLKEGEAFFDVAHDERRPFRVQLPLNLDVRVLGTSFRITAKPAEEDIKVAVATGKVAVNNKNKVIGELVKNQVLQYHKITGQSSISHARYINPVKIAFNGSTLEQVISRIAYIYNVKIQLDDKSLSGLKSTATFNSTQSPLEILDIICSLHHLKLYVDKNHKLFKINKL